MRFIREQVSGKGTTRYMFALGKEEAKIMLGLLTKAVLYMPKTNETAATEQRMRNMMGEIKESLPFIQTDISIPSNFKAHNPDSIK